MRRLLALVATAGAAVGLYAATATGGSDAVTPGQITALQKKVVALQKDMKTLKAQVGCLTAIGVIQFGGDTAGYHYKQPDGAEILTSALDLAAQGEQPQAFIAGLDAQCVQSAFRHFSATHGGTAEH
jgi:hypothetical protein